MEQAILHFRQHRKCGDTGLSGEIRYVWGGAQKCRLSSAQNGISSSSIRKAIEETPVVVREAQESVRMDGNGVNITEQSVELARNGYQMQYVFGAISSDIATLQAVIRG